MCSTLSDLEYPQTLRRLHAQVTVTASRQAEVQAPAAPIQPMLVDVSAVQSATDGSQTWELRVGSEFQ
jgi:hypothetical protein